MSALTQCHFNTHHAFQRAPQPAYVASATPKFLALIQVLFASPHRGFSIIGECRHPISGPPDDPEAGVPSVSPMMKNAFDVQLD